MISLVHVLKISASTSFYFNYSQSYVLLIPSSSSHPLSLCISEFLPTEGWLELSPGNGERNQDCPEMGNHRNLGSFCGC